jgi:hypothetical protein
VREQIPNASVVFATGNDTIPATSNGATIENAILLRKPFNLSALNDVLHVVAKRKTSG